MNSKVLIEAYKLGLFEEVWKLLEVHRASNGRCYEPGHQGPVPCGSSGKGPQASSKGGKKGGGKDDKGKGGKDKHDKGNGGKGGKGGKGSGNSTSKPGIIAPGKKSESHEDRMSRHLNAVDAGIKNSAGLSKNQKKATRAAASEVLHRMTPEALERMDKNTKGYVYYATMEAVTQAYKEASDKDDDVLGFYDPDTHLVHVDHAHTDYHGLSFQHAHEMSHALDGPDRKKRFSEDPDWKEIWQAEMGEGQLGDNAKSSSDEGWADFGGTLYGKPTHYPVITTQFPKCLEYWRSKNLWAKKK